MYVISSRSYLSNSIALAKEMIEKHLVASYMRKRRIHGCNLSLQRLLQLLTEDVVWLVLHYLWWKCSLADASENA